MCKGVVRRAEKGEEWSLLSLPQAAALYTAQPNRNICSTIKRQSESDMR